VQSKDLVNGMQKGYTIGLHRINNTSWAWYGPGNELVEVSHKKLQIAILFFLAFKWRLYKVV
jgi:hypothetical protein